MRKLCWFASSAAGAIFLAVCLFRANWLLPAGLLCMAAFPASFLFQGHTRRLIALVCAGAAFGFLYTEVFRACFRAPAEEMLTGEIQTLDFTVTGYPRKTSSGASVEVSLSLSGARDPAAILYAGASALELCPGDRASAAVSLRPAGVYRGTVSDYYPSRGVYLIGYTKEITLTDRPERVSPLLWPVLAAKAIKESLRFPEDVSGFVSALVTGDKSLLPVGLYAAFRRAGLAHVVVVSGLHISFLAGRLTALIGNRRRVSVLAVLAVIFFFAAVAGNGPSVLRAAFVEAFFLIAPLTGREPDPPTTLAAALMLVLLPCPYAAGSVSLQLSFAAAAGIYLISGPICQAGEEAFRNAVKQREKKGIRKFLQSLEYFVFKYLLGTCAVTAGALLFTTPLCGLHFREVSLAGPLSNLLALWAVSAVFQYGLASALLGMFAPEAGAAAARVLAWPARWVCMVARTLSKLPFAAISLSTIYLKGWFLLTCAVALLWVCFRKHVRPAFPVSVCTICLCSSLIMSSWSGVTGTLEVSVLDVGQGSSTLFCSKGCAVLVDCGGNSGENPGDIAASAVQALGTSQLEALILTHCHEDHTGGVPELLSRLDVKRVILPAGGPEDPARQEIVALAEETGCEVISVSSDLLLVFGDAQMSLYAPLESGSGNDACLSVLCGAGEVRVLVTGDMTAAAEEKLVEEKALPDIDLLVVGHHGSKGSTSPAFLQAVTPEAAVISSGWNNYGHPAPETLERLDAAGCQVYLTRDSGTVTFRYRKPS